MKQIPEREIRRAIERAAKMSRRLERCYRSNPTWRASVRYIEMALNACYEAKNLGYLDMLWGWHDGRGIFAAGPQGLAYFPPDGGISE